MDMIGGAIGAMGSIQNNINQNNIASQYSDMSAEQQAYVRAALERLKGIQTPDTSLSLNSPQGYSLEQYAGPEAAQSQQVAIDPVDRANQMSALSKLQGYSNGAADSELNAANYNAQNNASMQRQRADAATMQNLASRGVAGSGMEMAQKQQASQNAANSALGGGLEAAKNNALTKLQGNNAYLSGLGNLRGQDTGLATANANIINQFNMANTAERNRVNQANVGLTNQQNTMNTQQQNDYLRYMAEAKRQAAQQDFANKMGQGEAVAGQANTLANFGQNAGQTGLALKGAASAGMANTLGNIGQGIYQGVKSNSDWGSGGSNPTVEQTPQAQTDEEGSTFTGE